MDPQDSRDCRIGGSDHDQRRAGPPPIGLRLLHGALLFVVLLAAFFAVTYFGVVGDYRGDPVGSLADAVWRAALFAAGNVALSPLQWRLQRWVQGGCSLGLREEQQRR
jgi:hypothetical protein